MFAVLRFVPAFAVTAPPAAAFCGFYVGGAGAQTEIGMMLAHALKPAILADRLQKLVDNFVLTKMAYQTNPLRYEYRLTQKGLDLHPVIMAIVLMVRPAGLFGKEK